MKDQSGFASLAQVLQGRIVAVTSDADASKALEFGRIEADGSLRTDGYPVSIPKSDYWVCGNLLGQAVSDDFVLPGRLRAGVRVLVVWIGADAVVVDCVCKASEVI